MTNDDNLLTRFCTIFSSLHAKPKIKISQPLFLLTFSMPISRKLSWSAKLSRGLEISMKKTFCCCFDDFFFVMINNTLASSNETWFWQQFGKHFSHLLSTLSSISFHRNPKYCRKNFAKRTWSDFRILASRTISQSDVRSSIASHKMKKKFRLCRQNVSKISLCGERNLKL